MFEKCLLDFMFAKLSVITEIKKKGRKKRERETTKDKPGKEKPVNREIFVQTTKPNPIIPHANNISTCPRDSYQTDT